MSSTKERSSEIKIGTDQCSQQSISSEDRDSSTVATGGKEQESQ